MSSIEFNDEIVEIEYIGENECMDIEVSDNHLFYANDILTKNSIGTAATADMVAIYGLDEDKAIYESELHGKMVKNRLGGRVGETFVLFYDAVTLKMYDGSERDLWIEDAQKTGDERNTFNNI